MKNAGHYHDAISGRLYRSWRTQENDRCLLVRVARRSPSTRFVFLLFATHPILLLSLLLSFSFFSLFIFYTARLDPQESFGGKSKSRAQGDASFPSSSSLCRGTSSAKCPTKIGICRECRIPEVRSGLSERLLKVSF